MTELLDELDTVGIRYLFGYGEVSVAIITRPKAVANVYVSIMKVEGALTEHFS